MFFFFFTDAVGFFVVGELSSLDFPSSFLGKVKVAEAEFEKLEAGGFCFSSLAFLGTMQTVFVDFLGGMLKYQQDSIAFKGGEGDQIW